MSDAKPFPKSVVTLTLNNMTMKALKCKTLGAEISHAYTSYSILG